MSDCSTNFPPRTYSSSFYLNALAEGEKTILVTDTDDDDDDDDDTEVVVQEKHSPILDCFIATMNSKVFLVYVAFLSASSSQTINSVTNKAVNNASTQKPNNESTSNTPQTKQCFTEDTRRVRTFPTLEEYQGNHYSFDPRNPTYQGNIVTFSFTAIFSLSKNDFISFGSDSIMEIDLHQKEIKSIEAGTFLGLFCLSKLDLSYNNLTNLTEGNFEGLENLKELYLNNNHLVDIPDSGLAFITLKGLQKLDLSFNKIKAINKLSFTMLSNLQFLNLGHNKIKTIDERVFNYLAALKELRFNDNLLVEAFADKWKDLSNLTTLDLSNNYLMSFDTSANYSFYNLERLNLSGNSLQYLNVYWIRKNFHVLKSLDLANNSWFCEDFEAIKHGLVDLRITIPREVSCSEIKTTSTKATTTESTTILPAPSVVTSPSSTQASLNYGPQLVEQNIKIEQTNKQLLAAVDSLRNSLIVLFLIVLVGIVVEVGVRTGIFSNWLYGVRGRGNGGYLDSNDVESVGLIRR